MDAALSVLKNRDTWLKNRVILEFGQLVSEDHSRDVVMHRTQRGSVQWNKEKASAGHVPLLRKIVAKLHSPALSNAIVGHSMRWMRASHEQGQLADQLEMESLCPCIWKYVLHLMAYFSLTGSLFSHGLPQKYRLLCEPQDKSSFLECMALVKPVFLGLEKVEQEMGTQDELAIFHGSLLFPKQQWSREVLVSLAECQWLACPKWV